MHAWRANANAQHKKMWLNEVRTHNTDHTRTLCIGLSRDACRAVVGPIGVPRRPAVDA